MRSIRSARRWSSGLCERSGEIAKGLSLSSSLQRLEYLAAGKFTEFGLRAHLDLADAFLADPQLLADLCQRLLGGAAESVSAYDDPPLTLVELTEPVSDRRSPLILSVFALVLVDGTVDAPRRTPP